MGKRCLRGNQAGFVSYCFKSMENSLRKNRIPVDTRPAIWQYLHRSLRRNQMQVLFRASYEAKRRILDHFNSFPDVMALATHEGVHITVHDADTSRHKVMLDEAHNVSNWLGVENVKISLQNLG